MEVPLVTGVPRECFPEDDQHSPNACNTHAQCWVVCKRIVAPDTDYLYWAGPSADRSTKRSWVWIAGWGDAVGQFATRADAEAGVRSFSLQHPQRAIITVRPVCLPELSNAPTPQAPT